MTQEQQQTVIDELGNRTTEFYLTDGETVAIREYEGVWSPYSAPDLIRIVLDHDLAKHIVGQDVADICTGSGILGVWAAKVGASRVTVTDYSHSAVEAARQNASLNGVSTMINAIESDRFTNLGNSRFDTIISNPPVQPWLQTGEDPIERPTAGAWNEAGNNGRLVLDSLLIDGKNHLNEGGVMIFTHSSRHGLETTERLLSEHWGEQGKAWEHVVVQVHEIDDSYHGPYVPIWRHLEEQDGEKRLLTASDVSALKGSNQEKVELPANGQLEEDATYYTYFVTIARNTDTEG